MFRGDPSNWYNMCVCNFQAPPYFMALILLEIMVLQWKGDKHKQIRLNDAFSSLAAGVVSQLPL